MIIIILYIPLLKAHLRRKNLNIVSVVTIISFTANTLKMKNHLPLVENGNNFNAYEKRLNNVINLNASKEVKVFRGYHELHCKKNFQKAVTTK